MQNYTNKLLGLFVVFALAVALVPTSSAQTTVAFGSIVKSGDADVTYTFGTIAPLITTLDWVDDDGDGAVDSDEPVYYVAAAGALAALDIRCANPPTGRTAGSYVLGSHADASLTPAGGLPGAGPVFYDSDGDGVYDSGEQTYWDTDGSGTVSVNDVILSGASSCTLVKSGSTNFNSAYSATAIAFAFAAFDVDGDGAYSAADTTWIDYDGSADVSVQDVQVSGTTGRIITASDLEVTYTFGTIAPTVTTLDWVDDDGDGAVDSDEPVYYVAAAGALAALDIRCANPPTGRTAGSYVLGSHADASLTPAGGLPGAGPVFYDSDGDGVYDNGEQTYWDTDGSGTVSVNDVILSGASSCTLVKSGSTNFNSAYSATAIAFAFAAFDVDGDGAYSSTDSTYVDYDGSADASPQDVQVSGTSQGRIVKAGDFDVTYTFGTIAPTVTTLDWVDDDGDGAVDSDEPVYFVAAAGALAALDIRCANPPTGRTVGSFVLGSHPDASLTPAGGLPGAGPVFYDADGDGVYDNGEQTYWDTDGSGTVSVNDVILSGSNACTLVKSGSTNFNSAYSATAIAFAFAAFDVDGDGAFSSADAVYVDYDGSADASPQDVRLTGPAPAKGTNSVGPPSTNTNTATSTDTDTSTSTNTMTTGTNPTTGTQPTTDTQPTGSETEDDDGNQTPGFELVALVAALAVALVLVRRKL